MSPTNTRIARTAAGAACIIALVAAFGWFTFQFVPGTPRSPEPDMTTGRTQAAQSSLIDAESIVDVPLGQPVTLKEITHGKGFPRSNQEDTWSEKDRENLIATGTWRYELPTLDITATSFNSMSEAAFIEWYPHYGEAQILSSDREKKVFLAEISVTNPNDFSVTLPNLLLWSKNFSGVCNKLDNGVYTDKYLFDELYGEPQEDFVAYRRTDGWNIIEPGETRTFTIPFLVYKSAFANQEAYENPDPSLFCLTISDYDPPTIYRFWLG